MTYLLAPDALNIRRSYVERRGESRQRSNSSIGPNGLEECVNTNNTNITSPPQIMSAHVNITQGYTPRIIKEGTPLKTQAEAISYARSVADRILRSDRKY